MKRLNLWLLCVLIASAVAAQPGTGPISGGGGGGGEATSVQGSATLPATCAEKDIYQDTNAGGTEFYICTATNTWTKAGAGDGTIGGSIGATDNAIPRADGAGGSTAQGSDLTISDVAAGVVTLATTAGNALTIDVTEPAATTGASVVGDPLAMSAGNAVASTDTNGAAAGGSVTITAGNAARLTSGNANGGDINLVAGTGVGTGNTGRVIFPNSTAFAAPTIVWAGDSDTGFMWDGVSGDTSFVSNGTERLTFSSTSLNFKSTTGSYAVNSDTAWTRYSAGVWRATDNSTGVRSLQGGGAAVASATAMPLPTGRVFHVTGTTAITSITSTNFQSGVCVTLIFDDVLTFTDGSNLKLAGNFTTSADDTISLCFDGSNWFETARSVN